MADASTARGGAGEESAGGGVCSSSSKPAASGGRSSCERRDAEVRRKREDRVLKRAADLKVEWHSFLPAFQDPWSSPPREQASWDFVIQEAKWLANDVMQERMWKIAIARHLAYAALEHWKSTIQPKTELIQEGGASLQTVDKVVDTGISAHSKESIEKDSVGAPDAMEVDTVVLKDEDPPATPNGFCSIACGTEQCEPVFTFSWKNGSKDTLLKYLKKKEVDIAIEVEKMRIKYEHEYAVARRTATMSEADSEQESDGDLPILGYIGGMQVDRDELQNDDDGKAASESGRAKKRRPKRLQNLNDNDHVQQRDSKRPRATPAASRPQADAVQASGRPSGPWPSRRVPSPRIQGISSVLSSHEDQLLFAANGEFNGNWHIISDFLASSGNYMKPEACKDKIMGIEKAVRQLQAQQLQAQQHGQQPREDVMFHQVRSRVKDYLGSAISETIVKRRKAAVAQQHAVMMQRKAERTQQDRPCDPHISHQRITKIMLNSMGQRLLTPKDAWQRANHRPQSIPQQMVQRNNSTGSVEAAQAGQSHPQAMPQLSSQMGLDMPQGVNPGLGISGQNAPAAPTVATVAPNTQPGPHMVRTPGAVPPPNQNNLAFQAIMQRHRSSVANPALLQHPLQNVHMGPTSQRLMYMRQMQARFRHAQPQAQAQAQAVHAAQAAHAQAAQAQAAQAQAAQAQAAQAQAAQAQVVQAQAAQAAQAQAVQAAQAAQAHAQVAQAAQAQVHAQAQVMGNTNSAMGMGPQQAVPQGGFGMPGRVSGLRPAGTSSMVQNNLGMPQPGVLGQGAMPGIIPLNPRTGMQPNQPQGNMHTPGVGMLPTVPMNQQGMGLPGSQQISPQAVNSMQNSMGSAGGMNSLMGIPGRVVASSSTSAGLGMGPGMQPTVGGQMTMMGLPGQGNISMLAGQGVMPGNAMGGGGMHTGIPQSNSQLGPGPT